MKRSLVEVSRNLADEVDKLNFSAPVAFVYNPLRYARKSHERYLEAYGHGPKEVMFLGMNPGPFGMAQTGVPFGCVSLVRDWLKVEDEVVQPPLEHPKRPVLGFACSREEVSGSRLWGWARDTFETPELFFKRFFVVNYCPLLFLDEGGRNLTPDKLKSVEAQPLLKACDRALEAYVEILQPRWVIGVGKWAHKRTASVLNEDQVRLGSVLHPSPASPRANRGWAPQAEAELKSLGIRL